MDGHGKRGKEGDLRYSNRKMYSAQARSTEYGVQVVMRPLETKRSMPCDDLARLGSFSQDCRAMSLPYHSYFVIINQLVEVESSCSQKIPPKARIRLCTKYGVRSTQYSVPRTRSM